MTISSTINRKEYAGDDVTVAFAFPYYFLADADLKVYLDTTLQTITTHYTIAGAGDLAGGTVTFVTPPATGETVVILRDPAITQSTDWVENDPDSAEVKEEAFDRLTMICQRLDDRLDRAFTFSDSSVTPASATVPDPEALKVLRWNAAGGALENVDPGSVALATPADGSVTTAKLADAAVTYAKIQNVSATSRVIGRNTAGAGVPEEVTISQLLDWMGSAAQGDIAYRGATGWALLPAGTSGKFLRTQGASANPAWLDEGAWVDYSATSTVTGWSSFTSKLIYYKQVGKTILVTFDIQGTSNTTTASFTVPSPSSNTIDVYACGYTTDAGAGTTTGGAIYLGKNSQLVSVYKDMSLAVFTASGTKRCIGQLVYHAD